MGVAIVALCSVLDDIASIMDFAGAYTCAAGGASETFIFSSMFATWRY